MLAAWTRGPGGLVYAETASGRGTSWRTYDAQGRVAWSQDAAGNQGLSAEAFVPQHVVVEAITRNRGHAIGRNAGESSAVREQLRALGG